MLLINFKDELSLRWIDNCVLTTAAIGDISNATGAHSADVAKQYVPVVTLLKRDSAKLAKQWKEGFNAWTNKKRLTKNHIMQVQL